MNRTQCSVAGHRKGRTAEGLVAHLHVNQRSYRPSVEAMVSLTQRMSSSVILR